MENTHMKSEEPTVTSSTSETATVAASGTDNSTIAVTSSSPTTSTASAFQPFQQLHEAVLAAVNSHTASIPSNIFSAAVAAAAVGNNVSMHPHQPFNQQQQQSPQSQPRRTALNDMDESKKASIRASNRERKKKWRIHNEERNKDNDLRCRVNKRASKLYGAEDSPEKRKWVQEEFEKRRQKRMDKERRKHIVNNVLSVPGTATNDTSNNTEVTSNGNNATNNVQIPNIVGANQLQNYYTPLPQIDTATAAKLLDFPSDLQRQLLEQLNNSMMALTGASLNPPPPTTEEAQNNNENSAAAATTTTTTDEQMDTSGFSDATDVTNNNNTTTVTSVQEALQQVIAHGLSVAANTTNTTATNSTVNSDHNSPAQYNITDSVENKENESTGGDVDMDGEKGDQTANSTVETPTTTASTTDAESTNKEKTNEEAGEAAATATKEEDQAKEEKKPEYPMDAVLTLMQLNAGWRQ